MATALKDISLSGASIVYNGVQFGGGDSGGSMLPATYSLSGSYVYDDADRMVTHIHYTLSINAVLVAADESTLSAEFTDLQKKLSEPRKRLKISGLGCGFSVDPQDIIWGPKPTGATQTPIAGQIAWELAWQVEFDIPPQSVKADSKKLQAMAMNFTESYSNDGEGIATRVVSGYVQLPRNAVSDAIAKQTRPMWWRDRITVALPNGFQRLNNTWRENSAKNRLEFTVTDQEFTADPYPPGITRASGTTPAGTDSILAGVNGRAAVNVTLTTAPGVAKTRGLEVFVAIALDRQQRLLRAANIGADQESEPTPATVIPTSVQIVPQLWTRTTSYSINWQVTGNIFQVLFQGGLWAPVPGTDYEAWRNSTDPHRNNKGFSRIGPAPNQDIPVNLSTNTFDVQIGLTTQEKGAAPRVPPNRFACPEIPADGGWLAYEPVVRLVRDEHVILHRRAVAREPGKLSSSLALPPQSVPANEENLLEYEGHAETRILVVWRGMRVGHHIKDRHLPKLETVRGRKVEFVEGSEEGDTRKFNMLCHPVYVRRYWALYRFAAAEPDEVEPDDAEKAAAEFNALPIVDLDKLAQNLFPQ